MPLVNTTRRRPAAFTLIELLVVIAIIALLMGILLPAFSRARDLARSTASQARVSSLSDACEMFKQEHGAYPGLARWPMVTNQHPLQVLDSGLLAGGEVLTMCLLDYYYQGGMPAWIPMSQYLQNQGLPLEPDRRFIDLQESAFDVSGPESVTGRENALLDTFPDQMAILYFVARPGRVGVSNIYRWGDNGGREPQYLPDRCPQDDRDLNFEFHRMITRFPDKTTINAGFNFAAATTRAYRQDSFILISPGIDRRWFTGDDNRNFDN